MCEGNTQDRVSELLPPLLLAPPGAAGARKRSRQYGHVASPRTAARRLSGRPAGATYGASIGGGGGGGGGEEGAVSGTLSEARSTGDLAVMAYRRHRDDDPLMTT